MVHKIQANEPERQLIGVVIRLTLRTIQLDKYVRALQSLFELWTTTKKKYIIATQYSEL